MLSSKILIPIMIGVACILALFVGVNLAMDAGQTMTFTGLIAFGLVLMLFAREYWWFALFVAIGFGGYAYFGFKLYAHECLLAVALGGLIPSIAINPRSEFIGRPKLPWFFYLTFLYLCFGIVYSIVRNDARGFMEVGNVGRAYTYGLWPLLFVICFRWYGRSSHLPTALYLLEAVYLLRGLLNLSTIYFPTTSVLPGINFLLPGNSMNSGGLDDLRFVGHGIAIVACAILLGRPSQKMRIIQWLLLAFSAVALLVGGGRALLVTSMFALFVAATAARMWKTLSVAVACGSALIMFLNFYPQSIESLDFRAQRALSILIFDSGATSAHLVLQHSSDEFHQAIKKEGFDRWTSSSTAFFIGVGITPWDQGIIRETNIDLLKAAVIKGAADTGNYEAALWTILAPAGLIGLVLYISTLIYFAWPNAMRIWRRQVSGMNLSIAFLGSYAAFEWILFSPIQGTYPQIETLFAATAFYYLWDREKSGVPLASAAWDEEPSSYADETRA